MKTEKSIELPENAVFLERMNRETRYSGLGGYGHAIAHIRVTEPGNGFPQTGIWELVEWEHSKSPEDYEGFEHSSEGLYALGPIFIGDG